MNGVRLSLASQVEGTVESGGSVIRASKSGGHAFYFPGAF